MATYYRDHEQTAHVISHYSRAVSDRWWLARVARFVMPEDCPRGTSTTRWGFGGMPDAAWNITGWDRYQCPDGTWFPWFPCRVPFEAPPLGRLARAVRQRWCLQQCWEAVKDEPQRRLLVEPGWDVVEVPLGRQGIVLHFLTEQESLIRRRSGVVLTFREEMTVERMDDRWRLVDDYRLDLVPDRVSWSIRSSVGSPEPI